MNPISRRTSFHRLTQPQPPGAAPDIQRVEIPLFQRDYAQGRQTAAVKQIRGGFLDALHHALAAGESEPIGLDFVYGAVEDGTLRPLDGQQRLTTLFLLHWYIASRAGTLSDDHGWKRFSYATRQSARMFCEHLAAAPYPDGADRPSAWITDQSWYLFLWRHDPTIKSMLVMVDAIHDRFANVDPTTAWDRLTDDEHPAIWFQLLPLNGLGPASGQHMSAEDLYIKMNSRGKPLTEFENFKAHFEQTISSSKRAAKFAQKVDTTWSDLLWDLRGDDDLIDDEFLRYMEFVTEVCEWRLGQVNTAGRSLGSRTRYVFGDGNPNQDTHLDFLFDAFDIWADPSRSVSGTFEGLFSSQSHPESGTLVRLFFRRSSGNPDTVDLFDACCRSYGEARGRGRARSFSLGQTVLLYAVVIHLIEQTDDFPRRVRVLRNLVEASTDQLRLADMPQILGDADAIVRDGDLRVSTSTFNRAAAEDEERKAAFLRQHPELTKPLRALEDHPILRGYLGAFELGAANLEHRARAFHAVMSRPEAWTDLLGALLAVGEYQRRRTNSKSFLFGTDSAKNDAAWRELLTGASRDGLRSTRHVLAGLLDQIDPHNRDLHGMLNAIRDDYLRDCEERRRYDWRYYMAKYPAMRESGSSTYIGQRDPDTGEWQLGYSLCMLRAGKSALNGRYRDPYLLAIAQEVGDLVQDTWYTGYEGNPRWLPLSGSGAAIRCVHEGFELLPPQIDEHAQTFAALAADLGVGADQLFTIPQQEVNGQLIDADDRIRLGVDLVRRLADEGL